MRFKAFIFELEGVLVNTALLLATQETSYVDSLQTDLSLAYLNDGVEELLLQLKRQRLKIAVVGAVKHSSLFLNRLGLSSYVANSRQDIHRRYFLDFQNENGGGKRHCLLFELFGGY